MYTYIFTYKCTIYCSVGEEGKTQTRVVKTPGRYASYVSGKAGKKKNLDDSSIDFNEGDGDVTQSDVTQADVSESDVTQSDLNESYVTESDVTQSQINDNDVTMTDTTQANITLSEVTNDNVTTITVSDPAAPEKTATYRLVDTTYSIVENPNPLPRCTITEITDEEVQTG